MGFPFNSARISVFAHATEDVQKVLKALRALLPEQVEVQETKLKGHYGNPILALNTFIKQRRFLRELWMRMIERLREGELNKLSQVANDRIDETCHLYLRFDKQVAYAGELVLTEGSDAIHLRLKINAHPARREVAGKLIQAFIAPGLKVLKRGQG
jgi:hypothetical protein